MSRFGDREGAASGQKPNSVFLTDTEILDCPICYEPLTPPVFQCQNGHVACSICFPKLNNKCSFCRSVIGFIRNRAIEKAVESAKLLCPNSKYGCLDTLPYGRSHHHKCRYKPCPCPLSGCKYAAPFTQLHKHFSDAHNTSTVMKLLQFQFNEPFDIEFYVNQNYSIFLQEHRYGVLFNLNKAIDYQTWVNKISLVRIWSPSDDKGWSFRYNIEMAYENGWGIQFQLLSKDDKTEANQISFIFEGYHRRLKLDLCIGDYSRGTSL